MKKNAKNIERSAGALVFLHNRYDSNGNVRKRGTVNSTSPVEVKSFRLYEPALVSS